MPQNNVNIKLKIENTTKQDLTKSSQESFQMEEWDFPETIAKGESVELNVTFKTGEGINLSQDFGEVEYQTPDNAGELKIRAFWPFFKFEKSGNVNISPEGFVDFKGKESVTLTLS